MRPALVRRLKSYWKMEAGNVIVVPAVGVVFFVTSGERIGWLLALAMLGTSAMLVAGTLALRAHYLTVVGDPGAMDRVVPLLARTQLPLALLCAAALGSAAIQHWHAAAWTPLVVATWIYATLAALEYVNYFHIQLQHFDHAADWARLKAGRGFRASHLARAIKRYRVAS